LLTIYISSAGKLQRKKSKSKKKMARKHKLKELDELKGSQFQRIFRNK